MIFDFDYYFSMSQTKHKLTLQNCGVVPLTPTESEARCTLAKRAITPPPRLQNTSKTPDWRTSDQQSQTFYSNETRHRLGQNRSHNQHLQLPSPHNRDAIEISNPITLTVKTVPG